MNRNKLQEAIMGIWDVLEKHLSLCNTHGAEFITHGHWEKFVNPSVQKELLSLSFEQLSALPLSCQTSRIGVTVSLSHTGDKAPVETHPKWTSDWLQNFTSQAHKCYQQFLDVLTPLADIVDGKVASSEDLTVTSEAMSDKKIHEVSLMADIVAAMFKSDGADMVVDIGSGKGYLSCELARQHRIPVLGLDSRDTNTRGAAERDSRLGKRWTGLARRKQRKQKQGKTEPSPPPDQHVISHPEVPVSMVPLDTVYSDGTVYSPASSTLVTVGACRPDRLTETACGCHEVTSSHIESQLCSDKIEINLLGMKTTHRIDDKKISCPDEALRENYVCNGVLDNSETYECVDVTSESLLNGVCQDGDKGKHDAVKIVQDSSNFESPLADVFDKTVRMRKFSSDGKTMQQITGKERLSWSEKNTSGPEKFTLSSVQSGLSSMYIPVTIFVRPDMNLRDVIQQSASQLCPSDVSSVRLLLTGLHTCGSLAVTTLKLFLQDPAVQAVCCVGCCYHLMEEVSAAAAAGVELVSEDEHFPLSQFCRMKGIYLGRNARNLASQSIHRVQISGKLQGADFFWRALLEVLLQDLSLPKPDRISGMRGINKHSESFSDYAVAAFKKLKFPSDKINKSQLEALEDLHRDAQQKMAAFFQLKLVLAPVVEALILLDRLLFLAEQEAVIDAHLVQLFDPVISPRCVALIARKVVREQLES